MIAWKMAIEDTVSILVFVELALDQKIEAVIPKNSVGFNPCFRGTCSRSCKAIRQRIAMGGFQSLFSWNLLSIIKTVEQIDDEAICFNPCFRGTCSRSALAVYQVFNLIVSILVFVELALDQELEEIAKDVKSSFNPCFRGTCSRSVESSCPR